MLFLKFAASIGTSQVLLLQDLKINTSKTTVPGLRNPQRSHTLKDVFNYRASRGRPGAGAAATQLVKLPSSPKPPGVLPCSFPKAQHRLPGLLVGQDGALQGNIPAEMSPPQRPGHTAAALSAQQQRFVTARPALLSATA